MRVGVLEWICGGGLQEMDLQEISSSLRGEGMAMLLSVAEDLAKAGHEVLLSADARLFSQVEQKVLAAKYQVFKDVAS